MICDNSIREVKEINLTTAETLRMVLIKYFLIVSLIFGSENNAVAKKVVPQTIEI